MTNDDGRKPEGAPERSAKAGAGAPSGVDGNGPKRFSVQRKMAIVARLLRGEPLELVARETNVSIARLSEWRDGRSVWDGHDNHASIFALSSAPSGRASENCLHAGPVSPMGAQLLRRAPMMIEGAHGRLRVGQLQRGP